MHNILKTTKLEYKITKKTTTLDQIGYCYKLAPISAYGIVKLLPTNSRDILLSSKLHQHKDCIEESKESDSLTNHQPRKASWGYLEKGTST